VGSFGEFCVYWSRYPKARPNQKSLQRHDLAGGAPLGQFGDGGAGRLKLGTSDQWEGCAIGDQTHHRL